ncbi:SDR family NAD(P)-dependent oxidoreductase [Notoacmeibacter ruber]|uniref:SDR family NAD(P)-dependent oxidoreductase n=1 Tax=Notoacmeibacter ruber TaxID=2670375 RepID=A0A3L7JC50_9HYPH|nr:SDR family NAD(P)-dependent oxidoreductase [Notoacmeibacter ruber]RLQ88034.1 SDR family NAD(P)-dependent oxidoreductase [Notoacmeibacter ruber]
MSLYRAKPADGVCFLTGASSGIGRATALILARKGWTVLGVARSEDKLKSLADEAEALPGKIIPAPCDVTDEDALQALMERSVAEHGAIALAVFVAGNYWPVIGTDPSLENLKKTYKINVFGTLNGLVPAILHMRERGRGHVAIVGSVSAYGGLPMASAYGASKAALNNMAAALKFDLDKINIRTQIINPGFVDTPLTEQNNFQMPFLMEVDDAAEALVDGLEHGGFEVTFPKSLAYILKFINLFPYGVYFPVMRRAMGWKDRKVREPKHFFARPDREKRPDASGDDVD